MSLLLTLLGAGQAAAYSDTLVEAGAAADVVDAAQVVAPSVAELGGAAETVAPAVSATAPITEAGAAADTVSGGLVQTGAVAEAGAAAEVLSPSQVAAPTVAEVAAATDAAAPAVIEPVPIAEAGTAVEATTAAVAAGGALTEAGAAGEGTGAGAPPTSDLLTEAATAADVVEAVVVAAAPVPALRHGEVDINPPGPTSVYSPTTVSGPGGPRISVTADDEDEDAASGTGSALVAGTLAAGALGAGVLGASQVAAGLLGSAFAGGAARGQPVEDEGVPEEVKVQNAPRLGHQRSLHVPAPGRASFHCPSCRETLLGSAAAPHLVSAHLGACGLARCTLCGSEARGTVTRLRARGWRFRAGRPLCDECRLGRALDQLIEAETTHPRPGRGSMTKRR